MESEVTLDSRIKRSIIRIGNIIQEKKEWELDDYAIVLSTLGGLLDRVDKNYARLTASTLQDACRRIFENGQCGNFESFIAFFNAYLYLRKLQYQVSYHKDTGRFPD